MESKEEKSSKLGRFWLLMAVVFSVWVISLFVIPVFYPKPDEAGTFGDMFGAVNALFSGMALAGIIYTIFLQRNELAMQREELRLTREEFVTQNDTLSLQRFENTFFNIVNLYNEVVNELGYNDLKKRSVLNYLWNTAGAYIHDNFRYANIKLKDENFDSEEKVEKMIGFFVEGVMRAFYIKDLDISNFLNTSFQIFDLIDESKNLSKEQKEFYEQFYINLLSKDEISVLILYSIFEAAGTGNKILVMDRLDLKAYSDYLDMKKFPYASIVFDHLYKESKLKFSAG